MRVFRVSHFLCAVSMGILAAACGSSPMVGSPAGASPTGATIQGTVVTGATAASTGAPHVMSGASGIRISVTGTNLTTMTDGAGKFVISGVPSGTVELRFQGSGVDARLAITGLSTGQTLTITVRASGSQASLESDDDDQDHEAELRGAIQSIDLATSSLVVAGKKVVVNASTRILGQHDAPLTLKDLKVGQTVEVEGTAQADQSILARKVKLEDDNDDDHEAEFTGAIQSINAGAGSLVVAGRSVSTNAQTRILGDHDQKLTLADLKVGQKVEVEGVAQGSGVLARKIKLDDGHDGDDD